jgi:TatD DNase family protein
MANPRSNDSAHCLPIASPRPNVSRGWRRGVSPKKILVPQNFFGDTLRQDPRTAQEKKIVAVGECGLDYFYTHSPKKDQQKALRFQIELALEHNLPLIFHVRDAFDDFWPIFDSYQGLKGVLHSFTDNQQNAHKALERGLHIGINGIMTFTKQNWQLEIIKQLPLQKILLETDAPFLTPTPHRGTVNEPSRVRNVAEFLATLRGETLQELAAQTTKNAQALFHL